MSESESAENVEQTSKLENSPRKRMRHRKKQLYENILKQMEFYFSDANLTKDRFLAETVKNDPYVPLELFLKFNKIRSMTQDITDIAKAMKNSTFLELSEDKLKVKRRTPVEAYDADIRTVYVESIPVTASREWLEKVFSDYGKVAYISLPKFKNSKQIKGYGFIEFETPEGAQKCLATFTRMGCKLPTCMPPEELSSIKMFHADEAGEDNTEKEIKEGYEPPKKKKKSKEKKVKNLELKLTHESDSEKQADTPTEEIKGITTPNQVEIYLRKRQLRQEVGTPDLESKDEMTSHDESKDDDDSARKKKTRKRTAKERTKVKNNEAPKGALWGLQVLPKSEWKFLRNKYLNLQRKYMKEMKANLREKRHNMYPAQIPALSMDDETAVNQRDTEGATNNVTLERIPGVFVKEILPEPCLDVRVTKRTIRSNIHALHVDVKEGQTEVIIRFDSAKAADEYCTHATNVARLLNGEEEDEQWSRALTARTVKRARGRCRLLARQDAPHSVAFAPASPQPTHTHIRFDD